MSESTPAAVPAAPAAAAEDASMAGAASWEAVLASYAKQPGGMAMPGFPGGAVPFSMPFAQVSWQAAN